ncbi:Cell division coordinator CpoB [subsurface metagenome]
MKLKHRWFHRLFAGVIILLFLGEMVSASIWEGIVNTKKKAVYKSTPEEDVVVKKLFYEGLKLEENRKYKEAIEKFKKIVEKYPNNPDAPTAQEMIGFSWMLAGMCGVDEADDRMEEAYEELRKVYKDSLARVFGFVKMIHFARHKGKQKLSILKRLSRKKMPPLLEALVWYWMGNMYGNYDEFRKERKWYRKFMEKYPDHPYVPKAQYLTARSYIRSTYGYEKKREKDPENWEMAIKEGEKVVKNYPKSRWAGEAQTELVAGGYDSLHNYKRAIEEYQKALDNYDLDAYDTSNQPTAQVLTNMARNYEKIGKWKEAIRCYEKIIELYTGNGKYAKYQKKYPGSDITNAPKEIEEIKEKYPTESYLIVQSKDPKKRMRSLKKLVEMDKEKYLPLLVKAAAENLKAKNRWDRLKAAELLGKVGDKSVVPALVEALRDAIEHRDTRMEEATRESLVKIGDKSAIPGLIEVLGYGSDDQYKIEEAIGEIGKKDREYATKELCKKIKEKKESKYVNDRKLIESAVKILKEIGTKSAIPALIRLLETIDGSELLEAILEINKREPTKIDKDSLSYVLWILQHHKSVGRSLDDRSIRLHDYLIRRNAVVILGEFGDGTALPYLEKVALNDISKDLRDLAHQSMNEIKEREKNK